MLAENRSPPGGQFPPTIPVLVVEDNRLLRDGIAFILDQQDDLEVVAVAESIEAGVRCARETRPWVVLMDATLGDRDGHGCVRSLKQAAPEARVIVMDLLPVSDDVVEYVKAGASGFIIKDAPVHDVLNAVRSVAGGKEVLPKALTGALFNHIAKQMSERPAAANRAGQMTRREREVIDLIAQGLSNKDIASQLHLSTYTIKSHVHNVLEKLALHSRIQLVAHGRHPGDPGDE